MQYERGVNQRLWRGLVLTVIACLAPWIASAQPARIYVEGGPKEIKDRVLSLLRQSSDLEPVPYAKKPEANIDLQKKGGANVKCGSAKAFLPGPTTEEIIAQFRQWLPVPLHARRISRAARAQAWSEGLTALAEGLRVPAESKNSAGATNSGGATLAGATASAAGRLMLFGGTDHKTYLGCLDCSKYGGDSVLNTYGPHGSRYTSTSIFNRYSEYGSKYSMYSACNPYASDPPVIVDAAGTFYGRLTVNQFHAQRTTNADWQAWISGVCADR